jgi:hypothetical protein
LEDAINQANGVVHVLRTLQILKNKLVWNKKLDKNENIFIKL